MATIEKQLQELGLSYREARVYKAALELGRFNVAEVAGKSGIKRPTCYVLLGELVQRGLISINPQFKKLPYTAEPPDKFVKQIEEQAVLAKTIAPDLEAIFTQATEKPLMKFYSGQKGAQTVMEDFLKQEAKDLYYIASVEDLVRAVGQEFLDEVIKKRIERGITSHTIRMKMTEMDIKLYQAGTENLREVRFAPIGIFIPYTVLIYGKRVGLISTAKDSFGFIFESKDFQQTFKGFFDALWQISKV